MSKFFTLVLLGLSVGLGEFAASIVIGLRSLDRRTRLKTVTTFGLFETVTPLVGLLIGKQASDTFGTAANYAGAILLSLFGLYIIIRNATGGGSELNFTKHTLNSPKLMIAAAALSVDNLVIGFNLGDNGEPIILSALVIGLASVLLTLLGLEAGKLLGLKAQKYGELLSGSILLLVGIAIWTKIL